MPLPPFHARARNWWESILSGREPVGIPFIVILAFMRLTTHAALNENPMSVAMARERVESWEDVPIVRFLSSSPATLRLAWDLLQTAKGGGNLATDAMIAAHAAEIGATVFSNDRDFDRFPSIRRKNPLM